MNTKFHLFAAPLAIVVLFVIYQLSTGSSDAPAPSAQAERFIQVSRASWGMNCNEMIAINRDRGETGQDDITVDNVLLAVSRICNNRETCSFPVSTNALGEDPIRVKMGCTKKLEVIYRCDAFEQPTRSEFVDDETAELSCAPHTEDTPEKAATSSPPAP